MAKTDAALAVIVVLGLAAAVPVCVSRWKAEAADRTASVVVDGKDVARMTPGGPDSLEFTLRALAARGATAVAVSAETLDDLIAAGRVAVAPAGFRALEEGPAGRAVRGLWLSFPDDAELAGQVVASLRASLPPGRVQVAEGAVIFRGSADELKDVDLALPTGVIAAARRAGLEPVVRLHNHPRINRESIRHMLDSAAENGARLVIFEADEVLGYRSLVPYTAEVLAGEPGPISYGYIELGKQMGDDSLGRLLGGRLVRVHSIAAAELARMTPGQAVQRFVRAVAERKVRACYVRFFPVALGKTGTDDYDYLGSLTASLRAAGFRLGSARPIPAVSVPLPYLVVMLAGIVAGAVILLRLVLPVGGWLAWALFVAGSAAGVLLMLFARDIARQEKALLAALVFPSIGLVMMDQWIAKARRERAPSLGRTILTGAGLLIGVSACSLIGGIFVGAMLAGREYFAGVEQFRGVKLASVLPILGLALVVVGRMNGREPHGYLGRARDNFASFLRRPVILWEIGAGLALVAAALLFVLRTGNESALPVSGAELRARESLEQALVVRPRTKEFVLGHPALMLAAGAAVRGAGGWAGALLLAGAVGQVSVTNTYCHVHTPLAVSLLRTLNGLWLGLLVGAAALAVWRFIDLARGGGREPG